MGEDLTRSNLSFKTLSKYARRAVGTGSVRDLLSDYARAAVAATGALRGFVALAEFDAGGLVIVATAGADWTEEHRRNRLADRDGAGTITARVASTCRPVCVGDVTQAVAPDYRPFFPGVRSVLAVPIALDAEERVRGILNVESDHADAFTREHEAYVSVLAYSAALRLAAEDLRAREAALVQMGRELAVAPDISHLTRRVVEIAGDILRFEDCSLFLIDRTSRRLVLKATRGSLRDQVSSASYEVGEGLTGWVAEHGKSVRLGSPDEDPRHKGLYREITPVEAGAFLAVPIKSMDGVVGVLRVLRRNSTSPWFPNDFTEADEEVLATIASQVGAAIDNARLLDRVVQSERMAAWGEMSAMTSHQIGNRVFALKGALNELEYVVDVAGPPDAPLDALKRRDVAELLGEMRDGVARLEEMLGEFRDFVRAGALALAPVDAAEVVREVVADTFPRRDTMRLEVNLGDESLPVQADAVKLKRAFAELVENAVTMREAEGGTFTVTARRLTGEAAQQRGMALPAPVSGRGPAAGYAHVVFEDDGPGVAEENKERIFQPFVTSRSRGMGLGLAIVRGIIEAHHGAIAETGTPGKGARFEVFLPLTAENRGSPPGVGA
jgi:Osmosensitive K+ channel histidine kinase